MALDNVWKRGVGGREKDEARTNEEKREFDLPVRCFVIFPHEIKIAHKQNEAKTTLLEEVTVGEVLAHHQEDGAHQLRAHIAQSVVPLRCEETTEGKERRLANISS